VLSARSVENLVFTGNKIIHTNPVNKENKQTAFNLTACRKVVIEKNNFDVPEASLINAGKMTKKDIKTDLQINFIQ